MDGLVKTGNSRAWHVLIMVIVVSVARNLSALCESL